MAWKEMSIEEIAESLDVDVAEVKEKQNLIQQIVKLRKVRKISQTELAKMAGVSQSRIAQIESGIGTAYVTFDVLLNILLVLGYKFRIVLKKAA